MIMIYAYELWIWIMIDDYDLWLWFMIMMYDLWSLFMIMFYDYELWFSARIPIPTPASAWRQAHHIPNTTANGSNGVHNGVQPHPTPKYNLYFGNIMNKGLW